MPKGEQGSLLWAVWGHVLARDLDPRLMRKNESLYGKRDKTEKHLISVRLLT